MNKKLLSILLFAGALGGCVSSAPPKRPLDYPLARIFIGDFDDVWNATVRVLDIYAITIANREAGKLHTDYSNYRHNLDLYTHPDEVSQLEEVRYRLKIKLSKAYVTDTKDPAVRVQVVKELSVYRNFYLNWERIPTDLIEESVLLYRIGQRLKIERAMKKLSKGANT